MKIPASYILTSTISEYLQIIESCRAVINSHSLPVEIETNIRRQSVLKSALFSARIEGNPLTLDEITQSPSKDQKKVEVFNILKGMNEVNRHGARDISTAFVLKLHQIALKDLAEDPGAYRKEVNAIFNTAGIAIYMPPPPRQVPKMMERLITFANSTKEQFIPIRAALAHYSFEKVHPFLDGNGRVGRLLLQAILNKNDYGMKGLLSLEEYLDNHRSEYYDALEDTERDVTGFVEFMLEAIAETAQKAQELILQKKDASAEDFLLPRRAEIFNIIKDHKLVNFDTIRRRFLSINERTLRYDLKKLQDSGLIKKRGTTKGVYYEEVN